MTESHIPALPKKYARLDEAGLLDALEAIDDDVQGAKARHEALMADRLAVMGALDALGVSHRRISERLSIGQYGVSYALRPPDRRRSPKKAKPSRKRSAKAGS